MSRKTANLTECTTGTPDWLSNGMAWGHGTYNKVTVYTPEAEVTHVGGGSGESAATHTMKMVNRVRLFGRRNGALTTWLYFAVAIVTELRRGILGHRQSWHAVAALLRPSLRPPRDRGKRLAPAPPTAWCGSGLRDCESAACGANGRSRRGR